MLVNHINDRISSIEKMISELQQKAGESEEVYDLVIVSSASDVAQIAF